MTGPRTYAVITPARDEAEHLAGLAASLANQTRRPVRWIIVENGSADATLETARRLADELPWLQVVVAQTFSTAPRGAPVVHAFHAGLEALDVPVDVVVKLDADITVAEDYFERLLGAFDDDPELGLASGTCYDRYGSSSQERHVTADHVWGAARAYRWACLQDVLPLEECMGWDGIDVVKARTYGWRTATLRELPFYHHRREGERDGSRWAAWTAQGRAARHMHYRPTYLCLRTAHRLVREPAALAMPWGYLSAAVRREPRCADAAVVAKVRDGQRLRQLPIRVREALGL